MSRSRSLNRFHRYLARQKRGALRAVLPQHRLAEDLMPEPANQSRSLLDRLRDQEAEGDLLDAEV